MAAGLAAARRRSSPEDDMAELYSGGRWQGKGLFAAVCSAGAWRAVFPQPREDFVVPVAAVGRFQDPVAFVGKVDEFAGNPEPLQCGEDLLPLTYGNSKVEIIVDDEHGCFEVGGEAMGRMFFVGRAIGAPGRATVFVLIKPQFFGRGVHAFEVVDAAVVDECSEFAGLSFEPVHHVAAEGGTGGEHAFGVDPRLLFHVCESGHQVDEASPTPISSDLVAVFLPEAGTAAGIGQADNVTLGRPDLGIPAEAPAVRPCSLRSSVNQEGQWPAATFVEAGRCQDPHLHGITVGADDFH